MPPPNRVQVAGYPETFFTSISYSPSCEGLDLGLPLAEQITAVRGQVVVAIHASGRPPHFHRLDAPGVSQTEVEPRVAGRQVTSPADPPRDASNGSRDDHDASTDAVAVGDRPFQGQGHEMTGSGLVVQEDQRFILDDDQRIDPAVVIEVAGRQPAPQMQEPKRRPGPSDTSCKRPPTPPRMSWMGIM